MKIMVTGGAGFIGSNIAGAYLAEGHEVVVVDNLSTGNQEWLDPRCRFCHIDITNPSLREIMEVERPDVINHHAAQIDVRFSTENPEQDAQINIMGFLNLLEAARHTGVKKVIFASSGGAVYSDVAQFPATEADPAEPISPYGVTKLTGEKYLHYYKTQYGIDYVALRYANVYGPRQSPHGEAGVVAIFISKLLKGETPIIHGDGLQTRDYLFVDDVVACNVRALRDGVSGVFNVGTGVESSVVDLFRAIRSSVGSTCDEMHGPAKSGEVRRSSLRSLRLKEVMGFEPRIQLAEGIQQTVAWFKERV